MRVLGIETSCDETGLAIYNDATGLDAHILYSQAKQHALHGGVVPELASRDHVKKLVPLLKQMLMDSNIELNSLDGIAYTRGPGLIGALMVGASFAKALSLTLNIPAIGIHHMEGHLLAPFLEPDPPQLPFLALLVSGGHSMLIDVQGIGQYQVIGETLDDAVGEAFDKTAKLLGLGYPGGPLLEKCAKNGQPGRFKFPRPMLNRPGLDLSFSGIKTFAVNTFLKSDQTEQTKADIAYAFQEAIIDTLAKKCLRAIQQTGHSRLVVAGGVSANQKIRSQFKSLMPHIEMFYPRLEFCTDNGAMIAYAGHLRLKNQQRDPLQIDLKPRWPLEALHPV